MAKDDHREHLPGLRNLVIAAAVAVGCSGISALIPRDKPVESEPLAEYWTPAANGECIADFVQPRESENPVVSSRKEQFYHKYKGKPNLAKKARELHRRHGDYIKKIAKRRGVDPSLIYAVTLVESRGNPNKCSSAGACGYMQLMPETARYLEKKLRKEGVKCTKRRWPRTNLRCGTELLAQNGAYFSKNMPQNDPEVNQANQIAAFNSGRGGLNSRLTEAGTTSYWDLKPGQNTKENENYVPAVMAMQELVKKGEFGFKI